MANSDLNATNGLQGSSFVYDMGMSPNTRTAMSQKVRILAPSYGSNTNTLLQIGVLASFNPSMSRNAEPVAGIGFGDQIAELVPGRQDPTTANVSRALLYLANLWQATGYAGGVSGPVRALKHHRWPFDVEQQLVFSTIADRELTNDAVGFSGDSGTMIGGVKSIQFPQGVTGTSGDEGHTAIITLYETCWWTSWSAAFEKDSGIIMETGDMMIRDVHDFSSVYGEFMPTGNDPFLGQVGSNIFLGNRASNPGFGPAVTG